MNKQTAPSYYGRFYSLRAQPVKHHQEMEEDDDDDDCVAAANGRAHTHALSSRTGRRNQQQATRTSSTVRLEALLTLNCVNFELQERTACVDLLCDAVELLHCRACHFSHRYCVAEDGLGSPRLRLFLAQKRRLCARSGFVLETF